VWRRNSGAVPLHIPEQGRHIFKSLNENGLVELKSELERLSGLGSTWASSALGWLCICKSKDGTRDPGRAIELCRAPAAAGDPYAGYVLAWAFALANRGTEAVDMMKRAALAGFLPARLDLVTFVWNGRDPTSRNRRAAYDLLNHAQAHKAAMIWRCRLNRSGEFGWIRRLLGYFLMPVGFVRYAVAFWRNPFSCKVLLFQPWMTRPAVFDSLSGQS
jgi:hypothetical protein